MNEYELQQFFGENLEDESFYGSVDESECSILRMDKGELDFLGLGTVEQRKLNSRLGDIAVSAERLSESVDKTMESPLSSNSRLTIKSVSDDNLVHSVLLDNGFTESEVSDLVFVSIPSDLEVMPKAKWVIDKYTTYSSSLTEIKVYDKVNHKSNTVGFAFNDMSHDKGSKIVIGGKLGFKTYVAPYMVVKLLDKHNTLSTQLFNGYLLGLSDNEKGALKNNPKSHYSRALRQNAYNLLLEYEYYGIELFSEPTEHNQWAFKVLDGYKVANSEFWSRELELDISEFSEALSESLEAQDWRFRPIAIANSVFMQTETYFKELINFYNGEAVVEAINDLSMDKSKFGAVQSELVKIAEYYISVESEEDNSFSVDETVEDYDSDKRTDHSQSRGYKKAYLEKPIVENAIAKGVITEYIHSEHYSRSIECSEMELELSELRASSIAHERASRERFEEIKEEQSFWDRMEQELGVTGLTAFTPASNCPDREAEWASKSETHFAFFMNDIRLRKSLV